MKCKTYLNQFKTIKKRPPKPELISVSSNAKDFSKAGRRACIYITITKVNPCRPSLTLFLNKKPLTLKPLANNNLFAIQFFDNFLSNSFICPSLEMNLISCINS